MSEAFLYVFLLGFALIGIIAIGFFIILRIYGNSENGAYIIKLDESMKPDDIVDAVCAAQVRTMVGIYPKTKVYLIDYGLQKDEKQLAMGLCRGYGNFEILEAEDFYNLIKR